MDGQPASFLKVGSPERIATHDRGTIKRIDTKVDQPEQSVIKELRALSYLDRVARAQRCSLVRRWSARRSASATIVRVGVAVPPVGKTALPAR